MKYIILLFVLFALAGCSLTRPPKTNQLILEVDPALMKKPNTLEKL